MKSIALVSIIQLLTGRGCNITLFGPLKGVIFPKWLYFPEARSAEGKYGHERKYNSLQVQRMLYTPCQSITVILDSLFFVGGGGGSKKKLPPIFFPPFFFGNYGKIICRDSSRKKKKPYPKKKIIQKIFGKKKKFLPKKAFFGKKKIPKKAFFGKKRKCGKNNFKGKKIHEKKILKKLNDPR